LKEGNKTKLFYIISAATVILDQVTKFLARKFLAGSAVTVIPGFFDLELTYNRGGAFGILPNWAPLFIIVALVAIYAIVKIGRGGYTSRVLMTGLGLLLGGAIGNLIDRVAFSSRGVTDFISLHISSGGRTYAWPTFNIADIAIVLGAFLVFYYVYIIEKRTQTDNR
jgi:signal peptidase II